MFSQPARKRLQPARKRLQPVRNRLQPARKRLQLARKRLQSSRKRLQPASQPQDWITAASHEVPLGSSVKCTLRKQQATLGVVCALLCNFFESTGGECFRIIPDVTEPQQVELHVWSICFPCWHFSMRLHFCEKALAAFCLSIGVESWQTYLAFHQSWISMRDLHKYAGKRKTHGKSMGSCTAAVALELYN